MQSNTFMVRLMVMIHGPIVDSFGGSFLLLPRGSAIRLLMGLHDYTIHISDGLDLLRGSLKLLHGGHIASTLPPPPPFFSIWGKRMRETEDHRLGYTSYGFNTKVV